MLTGQFSPAGFRVVADNALELLVGTQAASTGYLGANIQRAAAGLHVDLRAIAQRVSSEGAALRAINTTGFDNVERAISTNLENVEMFSAVSLVVNAAGFASVASEVRRVGSEIDKLRTDVNQVATKLLEAQRLTAEVLVDVRRVMDTVAETGEKILDTLLRSRTVEAQQLVRQGCDNLRAGYPVEASERFTRSLEYDNTVYLAHACLAQLSLEEGNVAQALERCTRAVRFAAKDGPNIEAIAHCHLSNALEQGRRYAEAETALKDAIKLVSRIEWQFHRAELLVECGSQEAALEVLRGVIRSDARFFVVAMGSSVFSLMGSSFVSFLHQLDVERRVAAVRPLILTETILRAIEDLVTPTLPAFSRLSKTASGLRKRAKTQFEKLLSCSFADLGDIQLSSVKLRKESESLFADVRMEVQRDLSSRVSQLLSESIPGATLVARIATILGECDQIEKAFLSVAQGSQGLQPAPEHAPNTPLYGVIAGSVHQVRLRLANAIPSGTLGSASWQASTKHLPLLLVCIAVFGFAIAVLIAAL
jgi:hypothetical protein